MGARGEAERADREPDTDEEPTRTDPAGAVPPGGIVIGEFGGGAAAAGPRAEAEDVSRRIGRPRGADEAPPPVVAPVPGGIAIGRMTGGAAASGPDARATDRSEQFIEATPQLVDALRLLRGESGELRAEAAEAEREIQATGRVTRSRLRRLVGLAGRAAGSVGGQTAAGVATEVITGMLT
ncbi:MULTISPECIES: hypothetical protein [unclassified Streptomyces]|uniref:Uncharacterized protein n=1 Tax=Streptomyces salyersiae TaxID=3075530 RepID=A0ABU2RBE9_9ACTN|nr:MULTISPECIES: hypothetical protein [unclassified Streptomyces]AEN10232.1 putative secreted protein [Streptomyces sp. SirexAA-E]MDT0426188.1 hypothetical protein [Streptomyces sp. DSM 41770]MYR66916.1 hypothetical protein [Streptomyces sp. SID4939]MYT65383.1 hypothetical protein [Streptomyces sp. SID8357]MYT84438.1 hypothetical protein [Streptomyces sp. SID8360]